MWSHACRAVCAAVLLVSAAPSAARAAQPLDPDEVLLHDIGPDWFEADCPLASPAGGAVVGPSVCFEPVIDGFEQHLTIGAVPVFEDVDLREYVQTVAAAFGGEPFETSSLDIAEGRIYRSTPDGTLLAIVMAVDGYAITLILLTEAPPEDATNLLADVAHRQQDHVESLTGESEGGNAVTEEDAYAELDPLLLTPPPGSGLEIMVTTDAPLDFEATRSEARSQRVVDLVSRAPSRMRLLSSGGLPAVIVVLTEHAYDAFAATMLGGAAELPPEQRFTAAPLRQLPDAIGFRLPADGSDQLGIAFRQGRYHVAIVLAAPGPDEAAAAQVLVDLSRRQSDLLPPGATAPYFFPSTLKSVLVAVAVTTAVCGVAIVAGRLAAARRRRRIRGDAWPHRGGAVRRGDVVDVTRLAAVLRRRGLLVAVVDLAAMNAIVVGVLGVLEVLEVSGPVRVGLVVAGALGGISFTFWWAGRERPSAHAEGSLTHRWQPSAAGVGCGAVALVLLLVGISLVASGVGGLTFGPSLGGLERSQRFHLDPVALNLAAVGAGALLLIAGGLAARLARMWSRAKAERLRRGDPRPPVLYLRSFEDDALLLPSIVSARRPFLELFATRGADPFEESIAWQLAPHGPVVAVGRPGGSLSSLGAAREHLPDHVWQPEVSHRIAAAQAIVVTIGFTEGLRWELGQLATGGHLDRTLFLFPPAAPEVVGQRWAYTSWALASSAISVPPLPAPIDHILIARRESMETWSVVTADVRDEATYRLALDQAMAHLGDSPITSRPIATDDANSPSRTTASDASSF